LAPSGYRPKTLEALLREAHEARGPVWAHESLLPLWLIKAYEERVRGGN
jgi:hypothetical protein